MNVKLTHISSESSCPILTVNFTSSNCYSKLNWGGCVGSRMNHLYLSLLYAHIYITVTAHAIVFYTWRKKSPDFISFALIVLAGWSWMELYLIVSARWVCCQDGLGLSEALIARKKPEVKKTCEIGCFCSMDFYSRSILFNQGRRLVFFSGGCHLFEDEETSVIKGQSWDVPGSNFTFFAWLFAWLLKAAMLSWDSDIHLTWPAMMLPYLHS